jgi:hypothetical protein
LRLPAPLSGRRQWMSIGIVALFALHTVGLVILIEVFDI